jgi:deoxyribonuclease-4
LFKLGCQVSIAGKIYNSVEKALELGCNTMQIFSRNPRQWRKASIDEEDIKIFKEKVKQAKIKPVAIHIPYTLNLASSKRKFYKITIKEFILDLLEADKLGADYLITHMGSFKGGTETGGLLRIVNALKKILKETQGVKTGILLENTSGSGRWLGYTFSQQKFVLERLEWTERLGICLDTAHAWAAGYRINNASGLDNLLGEFDNEVGLRRLKVIHLNDTKEELNSRHDRHAAIGEGKIGKYGFSLIINHSRLKSLPFILETPKKSENDDIKNLRIVRELYDGKLEK